MKASTQKTKSHAANPAPLKGLLAVNWAELAKNALNYGEKSVKTLKTQAKKWKKRVETQINTLNLPFDRADVQKLLNRVQKQARAKASLFLYLPTLHTVRKLEKQLTLLEKQLQKKSAKPAARRAA